MADGADNKCKSGLGTQFKEACLAPKAIGTVISEKDMVINRVGLDGRMQAIDAKVGDKVYATDVLTTPKGGTGALLLNDRSLLSMGSPNNEGKVEAKHWVTEVKPMDTEVHRGSIKDISGKIAPATSEPVRFNAPGNSIGVRG